MLASSGTGERTQRQHELPCSPVAGARLIGLDWGTSTCRAYAFDASGRVVAIRRGASGAKTIAESASSADGRREAFEAAFESLCGDWLDTTGAVPVIACGMVGSDFGWAQAPYRVVPVDLSHPGEIASVTTPGGVAVHILPGLISSGDLGGGGVMRGEETQLLGVSATTEEWVLLPGTHSKWVHLDGDTVRAFVTCMTGELFSLLSKESTLRNDTNDPSVDAEKHFHRGVSVAADEDGHLGLLSTLFSARSLRLSGALPAGGVNDYLSGLLIGTELRSIGENLFGGSPPPIVTVGAGELSERYRRAAGQLGWPSIRHQDDATANGLWRAARIYGLIQLAEGDENVTRGLP